MDGKAIVTEKLVKKYGNFEAVKGIDLEVESGELFAFLGPNGAGKSTTINMLCTLLRPTSGKARVAGFDVSKEPSKVRAHIGLVFQDPSLDDQLTAYENLSFHAYLYDFRGDARQRINYVLEMVDLRERANDLVKTFSGGMKRRLEIARGVMHSPTVLFLDEPTIGLDPQTRRHIWDYLRAVREKEGITIFMTTHYMDEAEMCERVAIIDHGQIIALGSPDELKSMVGGDVVTFKASDTQVAIDELKQRYNLQPIQADGSIVVEVKDGTSFVPALVSNLSTQVESVSVHRPSLEDVFIKLTGRAIRDEDANPVDTMRARIRARRSR
jgi:ABC-2 type transport system ATP-binding protein